MYQLIEGRTTAHNTSIQNRKITKTPIGISQGTILEVKEVIRQLADQRWRTEYEELLAKNVEASDPKKETIREETRHGGPCVSWNNGATKHMYYAIPAAVL